VGQRLGEQEGVAELVTDPLFQRGHGRGGCGSSQYHIQAAETSVNEWIGGSRLLFFFCVDWRLGNRADKGRCPGKQRHRRI
jgi:hypothetical protein